MADLMLEWWFLLLMLLVVLVALAVRPFRLARLVAWLAALALLLGVLGLLLWLQPWRPGWPAVEARTQEALLQGGFDDPRITSDDFRWRYNVRAARGPKQLVASVYLGLLSSRVSSVTITTPEGGGSRLTVSVYYRDSSVYFDAHRWRGEAEAELVPLDEAGRAAYRSEADEFASLVMQARRGAAAR